MNRSSTGGRVGSWASARLTGCCLALVAVASVAAPARGAVALAPAADAAVTTSYGPHESDVRLLSARRAGGVLTLVVAIANHADELLHSREVTPAGGPPGEIGAHVVDPTTGRTGAVLREGTGCRCTLVPVWVQGRQEIALTLEFADPGGEVVDATFASFLPLTGIRPEGTAAPAAGLPVLAGRTLDPQRRYRVVDAEVSGGTTVDRVSLRADVLFAIDKATLTSRAKATLAAAVDALRAQPKRRLGVYGHTDDTGSSAHNLDLSRRRAQAVRDALAPLLGAGWTFEVQGFGETRPVAANERANGAPYPDGRARNRRVEIVALG